MTLKEAIEVLKKWITDDPDMSTEVYNKFDEAINTVINAYSVTDEEITTWVWFRLPHKITDHEWETGERYGLMEGAKAFRDGKIGGEK